MCIDSIPEFVIYRSFHLSRLGVIQSADFFSLHAISQHASCKLSYHAAGKVLTLIRLSQPSLIRQRAAELNRGILVLSICIHYWHMLSRSIHLSSRRNLSASTPPPLNHM